MADPTALSPLWWLQKLEVELADRQTTMANFDAYYRGDHPLPFLTKAHGAKMHNEFRQLLEDSRANFMGLVVDAVEERLRVEGFRLSARQDAGDDDRSWEIWQANKMDSESQTAFVESLVKGLSYLSVWEGEKYPTIAVEDPMQTIVGYVPGSNYRRRAAALKIWMDDWTGRQRANVWLPNSVHKFQARVDTSGNPQGSTPDRPRWEEFDVVPNRSGVVPIIPLRNRPRLLCEGESELADVFRIQNSINGFLFLLALAGYFGAHKQRWAVGLKMMVEESTGRPVEPFDIAVDKLIFNENPEAKFGEFQATDLAGYIKAIEQKVQHLSVISRVPKHYLLPEGQEPSGDAIKSAESGLVKKVEKKQRPFGEALEEAMALARLFDGETAAPVDSETVWAAAQTESEAVRTDAVIKQFEAGLIPWEAALEKLGYTQTQIARYKGMQTADALRREMLRPADEKVSLNINA